MGKTFKDARAGRVREGYDAGSGDLDDLVRTMQRTVEIRRSQAELVVMEEDVSALIEVEIDILRRAADIRAENLSAVIGKLTIWELAAENDDEGGSMENAVVRSVLLDLRRLDRRQTAAP